MSKPFSYVCLVCRNHFPIDRVVRCRDCHRRLACPYCRCCGVELVDPTIRELKGFELDPGFLKSRVLH